MHKNRRFPSSVFLAAAILFFTAVGKADVSVSVTPFPNLSWPMVKPFAEYKVEIATDQDFSNIIDRDRIANVARYVPAIGLAPGDYFYRITYDGFHYIREFTISEVEHEIVIPLGSGMSEIREALDKAREQSSTLIKFETGIYELSAGDGTSIFGIDETSHLIIDGQGSSIIIKDLANLAKITHSKDITLRNFTVDYDQVYYTAGLIESVHEEGVMELSLVPDTVRPETNETIMSDHRGPLYDPERMRMVEGAPVALWMEENWKALGGDRYRLKLRDERFFDLVEPGMVYITTARHGAQGMQVYESANVTIADVTSYYFPGIGLLTNFADDLKLIRFNLLRREDRFLAVQNGGTNMHGARDIGPWVEGGRFENLGDDNHHISSLVHAPIAQRAPNKVVINHQQAGIRYPAKSMHMRKGDRLAFFDRLSASMIKEVEIINVVESGDNRTEITVSEDLPELTLGGQGDNFSPLEVAQIYNLSRSCGNFVFRNNEFIRGRRIGILAKSGPGLIENNRFEEIANGGVEIWNAPWEGLYGHDILIQGNYFRRCGMQFRPRAPAPAVWVDIHHWGVVADPLHRNIRIINNTIQDFRGHAMELRDVTGLVVEGNTIIQREPGLERIPGLEPILLENAFETEVRDNIIQLP